MHTHILVHMYILEQDKITVGYKLHVINFTKFCVSKVNREVIREFENCILS